MRGCLVVLLCVGLLCGSLRAVPSGGDASVQGYYAWGEGANGILKLSLSRFSQSEYKRQFWSEHKRLCREGRRRFMIVELVFSRSLPGSHVPDVDLARRELRAFLGSEDGIRTYPELLYAVVPSEEHRLQDIPILNQIYGFIKEEWGVPVFQWLSEPLVPTKDLKSDGWVFDAYSLHGDGFYRHCQRFMLTGKPVFPVLWAAEPGMDGYYKDDLQGMVANGREKIAMCRELSLPMFWFAVCKRHGSVGCWMSDKPGFPELRATFRQLMAEPSEEPWHLTVPMQDFALSPAGTFSWHEDFRNSALVSRCAMRGGRRARLTADGLRLDDEVTTLTWTFRTQEDCDKAQVTLEFDGQQPMMDLGETELKPENGSPQEISLIGKKSFMLRIWGRNVTLKNVSVTVTGKPATEKALKLTVGPDGTAEFRENLSNNLFQATVESASPEGSLRVDRGAAVLMRRSWEGRQKIVFSESVRQVAVSVRCYADYPNWRCRVEAGLSRDGVNVQWKQTDPQGVSHLLKAALEVPEGLRECTVHLRLSNGCGVYPKQGAPARFLGYVITGRR